MHSLKENVYLTVEDLLFVALRLRRGEFFHDSKLIPLQNSCHKQNQTRTIISLERMMIFSQCALTKKNWVYI